MIEVLCITTRLCSGGVQTFFANFAPHLLEQGIRMNFAVQTDQKQPLDDYFLNMGSRIHHITPLTDSKRRFVRDIIRILRSHPEYRMLHAHMNFANFYPLLAARICGLPVRISHSHSCYESRSIIDRSRKFLWKKWLLSILATDYWACSSQAAAWLYGEHASSAACKIIPNAIDVERFRFDEHVRNSVRHRLSIDGKYAWVHVGTLGSAKNHRFLVELFASFHRKCPQSVLLLCGSGPLEDEIKRQIISLGLEQAVIMLGDVRNSWDYLFAADLVVFPSLYEGLPLSVIEAQVTGIPCIVSQAIPSQAVIVPDNIIRCDNYDKDIWLQKIAETSQRMISPEDREACYLQAAASKYNITQASCMLALSYREALKRNG